MKLPIKNTMFLISLIIISSVTSTYANDYNTELSAANDLSSFKIIVNKSSTPEEYRLGDTITRREMLKIMMNLSPSIVEDKCEWKFADLQTSDWWCKYAEKALEEWYIAPNELFRPDDNVSKIEALKMIMQAKGIPKDSTETDWRRWYVSGALNNWWTLHIPILYVTWAYWDFYDYDTQALRWWIFVIAQKSIIVAKESIIYGINNLEQDILTEKWDDWIYLNTIQMISKEDYFDKELFLTFFNDLKEWNIEEAKDLFIEYDIEREENEMTLSPFYPTCCSFKMYDSVEIYKNWIMWIYRAWNWDTDLNFYYIKTEWDSIIEYKSPSNFVSLTEEKTEWVYETYIYYWGEKLFELTKENIQKLNETDAYKIEIERVKKEIDELYYK